MDSDDELIRRARAGSAEAMDALVERYLRAVHSLAYRLSADPEVAKEIVHETFLRVYRSLPRLRADVNFRTWLYRIVTNVFLDERKRRRAG